MFSVNTTSTLACSVCWIFHRIYMFSEICMVNHLPLHIIWVWYVLYVCLKTICSQVDIAYIPFVERFCIFLSEVFKYDITAGRPKLAAWIEVIWNPFFLHLPPVFHALSLCSSQIYLVLYSFIFFTVWFKAVYWIFHLAWLRSCLVIVLASSLVSNN